MARHIEENERIKRDYTYYLRDAKGQDHKSIDKALVAIRKFEESTGCKSFKKFHRLQASAFKDHLERAKNARTGKPLGVTTIYAILRLVKAFFHWLVSRTGFKRIVSYADVEYFNNTMKRARVAHARRDIPYPSMEQCAHAFQAMPGATVFEKRDKARFAFLMPTTARGSATASLKLKHVNLDSGQVFHDGRSVETKFGDTYRTQFYPVGQAYVDCFNEWVEYLRTEMNFGPEDALFPKAMIAHVKGRGFANVGLGREGYAGAAKLNAVIRTAFANVQMPEYTQHSLRKTLFVYGDSVCKTAEELKAWSMNMGHEHLATSINSYLPVTEQRQLEIIKGMAK